MTAKDCILVVDDSPNSLRFLVDTLEGEGMMVLIAGSGEAALELLQRVIPDFILMDAVMPGLSGLETTRQIKRNPACAHVPVIFMTGLTDPEHVVAALGVGGVDYVRKPVVIDELLARIRVHLANARISHRLALGLAGRSLAALDPTGALVWWTPQAESLFARLDPGWNPADARLPPALEGAARKLQAEPSQAGSLRSEGHGFSVELALLESERPGETLIRVNEVGQDSSIASLQKQAGLTHREAEVLFWLSHGKTNRTISEILGISPRTVNKHLEQVFKKLGVETRAGASAFAVRLMSE